MDLNSFDIDILNIGPVGNNINHISVNVDPTIGAGVPADLWTQAASSVDGRVWTKTGPLDVNWEGGNLPGVDNAGGGSSSLVINLAGGGTCSVATVSSQLIINLAGGGTCAVNI